MDESKGSSEGAGYVWELPKMTPEQRARAREARAAIIRKAAEGWDRDGRWQRAMGVEPLPQHGKEPERQG